MWGMATQHSSGGILGRLLVCFIPSSAMMHGPSHLGVPLFATVADVRNGAGRSLTSARSDKQLQLLAFVSTLALTDASDVPHWYVNGIRIVTRITSLLVSSVGRD